jgi:hypothetical protein
MTERLFTPAEVDALIPRLTELMDLARERHRGLSAVQREAQEEQQRIAFLGGSLVDRGEWTARAGRLEALTDALREALETVVALGGVTKDLELGLVDFPARLPGVAGGEIVNLCWKHGETAVGFWHGLDEGYAQRKPLARRL